MNSRVVISKGADVYKAQVLAIPGIVCSPISVVLNSSSVINFAGIRGKE